MRKRVCIDINSVLSRFWRGYHSGIGRTSYELVRQLQLKQDTLPFDIVLYGQNTRGITARHLGLSLPSVHLPLPYRSYINRILSCTGIRTMLTASDLWHCPHNGDRVDHPEKTVFTLHDMILYTCKNEFSGSEVKIACRRIPGWIKSAGAIITCSFSSRQDIIRYLGIDPHKIHVINWGVDHDVFKPLSDIQYVKSLLQNKYNIRNPFFLAVSCGYGRKNTLGLLQAYSRLLSLRPANDLVILWKGYDRDVRNLICNGKGRIHALDPVSDGDLVSLYNAATALFYPSLYEGFGLPLLEGMACGTPVVTCANSSLPEVAGNAAIYSPSGHPDSLLGIMSDLEAGRYDIPLLRTKSIQQAAGFSWQRCVEETIKVYQQYL